MPETLTEKRIAHWANDPEGPVALRLQQELLPVEGSDAVIYPPTYADIGYNVDMLADGTKVALIDSVGSQANRMEPIFKREPYSNLVPQIEIELHSKGEGKEKHTERRSLLDLAHRSADAVVHASPSLSPIVSDAFLALKQQGDAAPLCRVAPTSLVFGVWDSRGGSNEKRPRLVRSIVRAWDVEPLHAAAQFNSIWKRLDDDQKGELAKEAKAKKVKLSEKGFADAPAVFRDKAKTVRVLGGIVVGGRIKRDVTVNLIALRGLAGRDEKETQIMRRYLLALALIAATSDIELYLREGCLLRYADDDIWEEVPRRGEVSSIDLTSQAAKETILAVANDTVAQFRNEWPKLCHKFDLNAAKKLLAKPNDEDH